MHYNISILLMAASLMTSVSAKDSELYKGKFVGPNFIHPDILKTQAPPADWNSTSERSVPAVVAAKALSRRDYTLNNVAVHERDGFCTIASRLSISSQIIRTLVTVVINTAILENGIPYELSVSGITVELSRDDFAPTSTALLTSALADMRDFVLSAGGDSVYEHASAAIGVNGNWQSNMAVGYSLWITINGHLIKTRDETVKPIDKKSTARQLGERDTVTVEKRETYTDDCYGWVYSDKYFGNTGGFTPVTCLSETKNYISCAYCCNGCTRDGASCCPDGQHC